MVYERNIGKKGKENKEYARAFMDTGVFTSRISKIFANRIGFLSTTKYFDSLGIPKSFNSLKEAQKYIDENEKRLTLEDGIKRVAKILDDGMIKVRPVIQIKVKISGDEKEIEVVILDDSEYYLIVGREELKGYLIDTSKTFKN